MSLPPEEFLRRFLQHVPPKGFHRIRAFGLLHPAHRGTLRQLQLALTPPVPADKPADSTDATVKDAAKVRAALRCPSCGQPALVLIRRLSPAACLERWAAELAGDASARAPPADAPSPAVAVSA